jgi:hypothetical protein
MNAKDVFRYLVESGHGIVEGCASDLSDADLLVRVVPGANHLAWQLGHMISGTRMMLLAIGQEAPELPAGFEAAHAKEAAGSDDRGQFATKAQYLALADKVKAASLAAIDRIADEDLDKPGPERMRQYAPTVGAVLTMLGGHWMMHAGQFASVRRKLAKPVLF